MNNTAGKDEKPAITLAEGTLVAMRRVCLTCKGAGVVTVDTAAETCETCGGGGYVYEVGVETKRADEMTADEAEAALVALREPATMEKVERYWRTSAGMVKTDKEMRPRDPRDHYPTPPALARAAISLFPDMYDHDNGRGLAIFDIGVGNGVWGQAAVARWPNARVNGCDIAEEVGKPDGYKSVFIEDIREHAPKHQRRYDIVIGNPPYSLMEECVRCGMALLKPGGSMIMLGRLEFLASQKRGFGIVGGKKKGLGLFETHRPNRVWILSERPSFTGNSKTDATEYALYEWVNGYHDVPFLYWLLWRDTP